MTATLVTEIQHALEERLLPDLECLPSLRTGFAWPFLPKVSTSVLKSSSEMTRQDGTTFKRERSLRRKHYFLRTSSLDKIKQFPAYLCTKSSRVYPNALHFLEQLRAYRFQHFTIQESNFSCLNCTRCLHSILSLRESAVKLFHNCIKYIK
ncbi:unnamed protein product, partial [Timema podura]|nr:unnamed protein product [Timema podura]